jgi:hypothetical protein
MNGPWLPPNFAGFFPPAVRLDPFRRGLPTVSPDLVSIMARSNVAPQRRHQKIT